VQADTQRLAQCVRNYLANAIRFSEMGTSIDVQVAVLRPVQAIRLAKRAPRSLDSSRRPPDPPLRITFPPGHSFAGDSSTSSGGKGRKFVDPETKKVVAPTGMFVSSRLSSRRLG